MKKECKYADLKKVIRVAKSCTKAEHCGVTMKMISNYIAYHGTRTGIVYLILSNLIDYLQDTRRHAEEGYHKPQISNYRTVRTFPDINDYLFDIIGIRV
jgi:hypothetical protein